MNYCYMRISTEKQEQTRQELMMKERGIPQENWYQDEISGGTIAKTRPEFEKMLKKLREDDTIYFESMSRLGRSIIDLINTVNLLTKEYKVNLVFIKENITLSVKGNGLDATGTLFFNIMAAMAQFERDLTRQRTIEGLKAKKEAGITLGRPTYKFDMDTQFIEFYEDWNSGMTFDELMSKYEISRPTVSKIVKRCKAKKYAQGDFMYEDRILTNSYVDKELY